MTFSSRRGASREGSLDQYLKEISQYPLIDRADPAYAPPTDAAGRTREGTPDVGAVEHMRKRS